jgi:hypothetical protein
VYIDMATLLTEDGEDWRDIDADLIVAVLWSVAIPGDGIEHIRARCSGNRIDIVVFRIGEFFLTAPEMIVEMLRRANVVSSATTR